MYDTILVTTDGSPAAEAAIEPAVDLAARYDATLHALYVVDVSAFVVPDLDTSILVAGFEQEGDEAVERVADAAASAGVACETFVVQGTPGETIIDHVADKGADCVVMSRHGRGGLSRMLLGSTTDRVLRRAGVPVLVIHAPPE